MSRALPRRSLLTQVRCPLHQFGCWSCRVDWGSAGDWSNAATPTCCESTWVHLPGDFEALILRALRVVLQIHGHLPQSSKRIPRQVVTAAMGCCPGQHSLVMSIKLTRPPRFELVDAAPRSFDDCAGAPELSMHQPTHAQSILSQVQTEGSQGRKEGNTRSFPKERKERLPAREWTG